MENTNETVNIGEDLKVYMNENLEDAVESHLDAWKDRYHRKSRETAVNDFKMNHDTDADIEYVEDEELGRKLTDEERQYYKDAFANKMFEIFYL